MPEPTQSQATTPYMRAQDEPSLVCRWKGKDCPLDLLSGVGNPGPVPAFKVPTPFKMGVGNKLTFFWKKDDLNAGLAGVSVQVQGVKAAQVGTGLGEASKGARRQLVPALVQGKAGQQGMLCCLPLHRRTKALRHCIVSARLAAGARLVSAPSSETTELPQGTAPPDSANPLLPAQPALGCSCNATIPCRRSSLPFL